MLLDTTLCGTCDGVNLVWDVGSQGWLAPYVEGGWYCECPYEDLEARNGRKVGVDNDLSIC